MKCSGERFYLKIPRSRNRSGTMMHSLDIIVFTAAIILNFDPCYSACARAEYEINGECCPMCAPGNRVYKHCTEFTSTTCVPCSYSSYTSEPNGLITCLPCSICDPGRGLKIKTACTGSSDAVCEAVEGFYCTDYKSSSCIQSKPHSKCSPGQYIEHRGTADRDSVCAGCSDGSYSDGSLQACQPHSLCEDMGLRLIKPGSNSSDAECGNKTSTALIAGVTAGLIVVAAAAGIAFYFYFFQRGRCFFSQVSIDDSQPNEEGHTPRSDGGEEIELRVTR